MEEEEEEEEEGGMSSPGDLSALGGVASFRKIQIKNPPKLHAFEGKPGIKRGLRRYKCHRLTAGRGAAHADL